MHTEYCLWRMVETHLAQSPERFPTFCREGMPSCTVGGWYPYQIKPRVRDKYLIGLQKFTQKARLLTIYNWVHLSLSNCLLV